MAATLKDVAKLAEVDIGSVSRTLRNHPRAQKLRPETRQRILDAARKLGYRRNQFAAAMRTGVNATIAIINSGDYSIGHSQSATRVLYGILDAAGASNYALKTYTDNDLPSCIEEILSSQIKHVISMSTKNGKREETAFLCRQYGLNLVFVYETGHGEFPAVASGNYEISRETVKYLAAMGHRRIALVCGEYQFWHYMTEKYNGYLAGLKESGIEPEFSLMICEADITPKLHEMLDRPPETRPTAFFCIGDGMAMQVQRMAIRKGLRVPEDVSTTGFGYTDSGENALSPLTSVNEMHENLGSSAFRLLIHGKLDLPQEPDGTYRVPAELIKRESVAKLN